MTRSVSVKIGCGLIALNLSATGTATEQPGEIMAASQDKDGSE